MSKLTAEQKEEIKERYFHDTSTIRSIAEDFGVSRSTINRIINPQYAEAEREKNSARMREKRTSYPRKRYDLHLHAINDADIIEKLDSIDNKNGYIKELIREDINK